MLVGQSGLRMIEPGADVGLRPTLWEYGGRADARRACPGSSIGLLPPGAAQACGNPAREITARGVSRGLVWERRVARGGVLASRPGGNV